MTKQILSLSIALAGVCTLSLTSFAEDAKPAGGPGKGGPGGPGGRGPGGNPEERVKHMKENLGLSDDQAAKILEIFKKSGDARKALQEDTTLSADDKHAKMEALGKSSREEVAAVLTPEQKEKFKAEMEKRRAEGHGPGGPGAGGPPPAAK